MNDFTLIDSGIETAPFLAQIEEHPELWNQNDGRTREGSPHYGIPDIWVRYRAQSEVTDPAQYNEPHWASFYPAWDLLPAMHPIVFGLMAKVRATYLGGILITKIPPKCSVRPHTDQGGWHAENYPLKIYIPLKSNPECVNYCAGSQVTMRAGEAWEFDNLKVHSVYNNGDEDRITLIVCFRTT